MSSILLAFEQTLFPIVRSWVSLTPIHPNLYLRLSQFCKQSTDSQAKLGLAVPYLMS